MTCKKCARCCYRLPCDVTFEELPGIAQKMNLSIEDFFDKYLMWDFYIGDDEDEKKAKMYFLVFRRVDTSEESEHVALWNWAFQNTSPCVFLTKENLCSIHAFKPESGSRQDCMSSTKDFVSKKEKAEAWMNKAKKLGLPMNYHEFNVSIFYKDDA